MPGPETITAGVTCGVPAKASPAVIAANKPKAVRDLPIFIVSHPDANAAIRLPIEANQLIGGTARHWPLSVVRFLQSHHLYQIPISFHQAKPIVDQIPIFASDATNPAFHHFANET